MIKLGLLYILILGYLEEWVVQGNKHPEKLIWNQGKNENLFSNLMMILMVKRPIDFGQKKPQTNLNDHTR